MRDHGPHHGRLGTADDCYDGSPWELHHGELVDRPRARARDRVVIPLVLSFLRTHARRYLRAAVDVYCDLGDDTGPSLRAPDVVLVEDSGPPVDEIVRVTPVLAVEVRATQSKKHLDAKVALFVEHDWPLLWIAHAERRELEIHELGAEAVLYAADADFPLPPALDKHNLRAVPVAALFDELVAEQYADGWVRAHALSPLFARKLGRPLSLRESEILQRKVDAVGPDLATDAALDLDPAALTAWLAELAPR